MIHMQSHGRALAALIAGVVLITTTPAQAASVVKISSFGSNPGNLALWEYIPDSLPSNSPLVVAMHGASSDHTLMSDTAGWKELADRYKFALAMPETNSNNNMYKSFRFHDTAQNSRGNGEALSIKQMVDYELANHNLDATRVFATGFSAGAFETIVMLAAYPDVFKAGGPYAGGAYYCNASSTANCGKVIDKTPVQWGDLVRAQNPSYAGAWPTVFAAQGDKDNLDDFAWLQEILDQWSNVHGIDQTADVSDTIKTYPHKVYKNASGVSKVETLTITGEAHKYPVDPGTGADQCGTVDAFGLTSNDDNICLSYWIAKFFGIIGTPGTNPPPPPPPPPPGGTQVDYLDEDANDGYVRANTDGTSPDVGLYECQTGMGMGKSTEFPYKHIRTMLSFDTSSIPDGAQITQVWLTITGQLFGGNPWNDPAGNTLVVDVNQGCYGSSCTVGADDWAAYTHAHPTATIAQFSSGSKSSSDFDYAGRQIINQTGKTQIKLRFSSFQSSFNYFTIYGCNSSSRAVLHVKYQ